ncbi:uncharacterized protein PFL1_01521 [Pseudozyma flocculosa PF-1]|uniref:uncharacterized protein n=1 Tax=Pseudozyma flocculosa PF-1 TaxID=1277687 RepID=UPI000456036A|nr:uncharacterized protein PFL1_01521 [Pseudozyma flocculosa PF-1]EPQ31337.1 hypothetical protein PFL1_01521 [Pseudozyma flocculosa PF-1]
MKLLRTTTTNRAMRVALLLALLSSHLLVVVSSQEATGVRGAFAPVSAFFDRTWRRIGGSARVEGAAAVPEFTKGVPPRGSSRWRWTPFQLAKKTSRAESRAQERARSSSLRVSTILVATDASADAQRRLFLIDRELQSRSADAQAGTNPTLLQKMMRFQVLASRGRVKFHYGSLTRSAFGGLTASWRVIEEVDAMFERGLSSVNDLAAFQGRLDEARLLLAKTIFSHSLLQMKLGQLDRLAQAEPAAAAHLLEANSGGNGGIHYVTATVREAVGVIDALERDLAAHLEARFKLLEAFRSKADSLRQPKRPWWRLGRRPGPTAARIKLEDLDPRYLADASAIVKAGDGSEDFRLGTSLLLHREWIVERPATRAR